MLNFIQFTSRQARLLIYSRFQLISTWAKVNVVFLLRVVIFMTARPIIAYSICKNLKKEIEKKSLNWSKSETEIGQLCSQKLVKSKQVGIGNETARPIVAITAYETIKWNREGWIEYEPLLRVCNNRARPSHPFL